MATAETREGISTRPTTTIDTQSSSQTIGGSASDERSARLPSLATAKFFASWLLNGWRGGRRPKRFRIELAKTLPISKRLSHRWWIVFAWTIGLMRWIPVRHLPSVQRLHRANSATLPLVRANILFFGRDRHAHDHIKNGRIPEEAAV